MAKTPKAAPNPQTAKIEEILDQMKSMIEMGMDPKTFDTDVEDELRKAMRPKIKKRLDDGGIWEDERDNPLICALHFGEIAKILTKGAKVSKNVAKAALAAIQNDEHCKPGAAGGGDWCG